VLIVTGVTLVVCSDHKKPFSKKPLADLLAKGFLNQQGHYQRGDGINFITPLTWTQAGHRLSM